MPLKVGYFTRETAISLRRNISMTIAGVLTVAVSLFLFGGIQLLSKMVDHGTARWEGGVELEIFFKADASESQIRAVQAEFERSPDIRRFRFISKKEAFLIFKELFSDRPDIVAAASPEALPPSFRVVPKQVERTKEIALRFDGRPGVDEVVTAADQVDRILNAIRWVRTLFFSISAAQLLSALILIVNTIRLATVARRREIEVMKLVGATNWFIRVPFMAEGLVQGLTGAAAAFGGIYALQVILSRLVQNSKNMLTSTFYVTVGDALSIGLIVMLIGAFVGIVGSVIGLRRLLEV